MGSSGQMYNLADDPAEINNLYDDEDQGVSVLKLKLNQVKQGNYLLDVKRGV